MANAGQSQDLLFGVDESLGFHFITGRVTSRAKSILRCRFSTINRVLILKKREKRRCLWMLLTGFFLLNVAWACSCSQHPGPTSSNGRLSGTSELKDSSATTPKPLNSIGGENCIYKEQILYLISKSVDHWFNYCHRNCC